MRLVLAVVLLLLLRDAPAVWWWAAFGVGARVAVVQERVVDVARQGVGKAMRERDDMRASHARCTVSSHADDLSQTMVSWTLCGPISKFGDLDCIFGS